MVYDNYVLKVDVKPIAIKSVIFTSGQQRWWGEGNQGFNSPLPNFDKIM